MDKKEMIYICASWADRRKCCFCPSVCFVHSCSDGHFRCDTCANQLVKDGKGEYGGSPRVSLSHDHQLEQRKITFLEFAKIAMADDSGFTLEPWQETLMESLKPGRQIILPIPLRDRHDRFYFQRQLETLRTCWRYGQSTVMYTPDFCDLNRPKIIFDEFLDDYK